MKAGELVALRARLRCVVDADGLVVGWLYASDLDCDAVRSGLAAGELGARAPTLGELAALRKKLAG